MPNITQTQEGLTLMVKVVPNSSKNSIEDVLDGMLKVKIASVPEKGKANKTLAKFLAGKLGIRAKDVEIIAGTTNPVKKVLIKNINLDRFVEELNKQ